MPTLILRVALNALQNRISDVCRLADIIEILPSCLADDSHIDTLCTCLGLQQYLAIGC